MLKQKRRSAPPLPKRVSAGIVAPSAMLDVAGIESADSPGRQCPASRVYETMELRAKIFDLIDRDTLAGMMRLERSAIASVASVLYRHIHVSVVSEISRSSPRRNIYCDSVRTIDRSPRVSSLVHNFSPESDPISFDCEDLEECEILKSLLEHITGLRLAFPSLRSLLYEEPANAGDDRYIVHLCDEEITVNIISVVELEISKGSTPPVDIFPDIPTLIGRVRIRHMLWLTMDIASGYDVSRRTSEAWKTWMYHNPLLDRRVIALHTSQIFRLALRVTSDDLNSFITLRASPQCEHLQEIVVRLTHPLNAGEIFDPPLPWELRALRVECAGNSPISPNWEDIVEAIGKRCPLLQELSLADGWSISTGIPLLIGLPQLRRFFFSTRKDVFTHINPFELARHLHRLGSRDCAFRVADYRDRTLRDRLQSCISNLKSNRLEYAYLHTIGVDDLDLWKKDDLLDMDFLPGGEQLQRLGWKNALNFSTGLVDKEALLDTQLELQYGYISKFKDAFAGAVGDLEGTEGDLIAQGEVIKRHFEVAEKQKKGLRAGFKAVRATLKELEEETESAGEYTKTWLEHQAPKPKSG